MYYGGKVSFDGQIFQPHGVKFPFLDQVRKEAKSLVPDQIKEAIASLLSLGLLETHNGHYTSNALGKSVAYTHFERQNHTRTDFLETIRLPFEHLSSGSRIVDVGSSAGILLPAIKMTTSVTKLNYLGIDLDLPMLKASSFFPRPKGITPCFVQASGESLPVANASADIVFSRGTLFFMRPQLFFREAYRVLKPEGTLFIITPTWEYHIKLLLHGSIKQRGIGGLSLLNGLLVAATGEPAFFSKLYSYSIFPRVIRKIATKAGFKDVKTSSFQNENQVCPNLRLTAKKQ